MKRPTLDDLQREEAEFIGPPVPSTRPKMQGKGEQQTVKAEYVVQQFPGLFQKPGD